ncbi:hypothetical protein NSK_008747, partial [Nannochloropsis salina CCMP1776]
MAGVQFKASLKAAQEALERNDHATAYAQLSQENSEGNLPYPYLVSKGVAAHGLGKVEEALSLLQRASGLRSDLPKAWKALGDVYEGQRRWEEAIQATEVKREGGGEGEEGGRE